MTGDFFFNHYRNLLKTADSSINESADPGSKVLSDEQIKIKIDFASEQARRIIQEQLMANKPLLSVAGKIKTDGGETIKALINGDTDFFAKDPSAYGLLEVIVKMDGTRPSFLIKDAEIDFGSGQAGAWKNQLDASKDLLKSAIPCVGRIDISGNLKGTGFLIAKNLLITNRHVLQLIAQQSFTDKKWTIFPNATVDFAAENGNAGNGTTRKFSKVVFAGSERITGIDHNKLDLALLALEDVDEAFLPSKILSVDATGTLLKPGTRIYTIGHPADPGVNGKNVYGDFLWELFKDSYGYKRLAPGLMTESFSTTRNWRLSHDASTLGGSSGSVILIAGNEFSAAGLHYGGTLTAPSINWGHILGKTLDEKDGLDQKTLRDHLEAYGVILI